MEVAPEEVEALAPTAEVDHSGLVRMEREPEVTQDGGRPPLGFLGLALRGAQHHEVVRVADDFPGAMPRPGPIEGVQVNVGKEGRDDPSLRSPGDRLGEHPVCQHSCTQPLAKELEHPTIRYPLADQREKSLVVDLAERAGYTLPTSRTSRRK
jgi:hypothetical protein